MNFRIIYNENTGQFLTTDYNRNSEGFETVAEDVPLSLCYIFIDVINRHYIAGMPKDEFPTIGIVRHEYVIFLNYLNGLMEQKLLKIPVPGTNETGLN